MVDNKTRNLRIRIREKFFKWLFLVSDIYKVFRSLLSGLCHFIFLTSLAFFILLFLFYIGFHYSDDVSDKINAAFRIVFFILFFTKYIPELLRIKKKKGKSLIFRLLILLFAICVFLANADTSGLEKVFHGLFHGSTYIIVAIVILGISETSDTLSLLTRIKIPPALIFSISFLLIILAGSGFLMLPKAHYGSLSFIDSLFTAVSAVCVTGLVVLNTATAFTTLGQIIILCLIQIGGLGIMTFTGFFSYIFTSSGSSFSNRLLLKEIFSAESLNNLFKLLVKIIMLTFITELAGAVFIYYSIEGQTENILLLSVFHSVSAFCNAGFSTLPEGLTSPLVAYNTSLQISVAILVVMGGIGFPVLVNFYSDIKHFIVLIIRKLIRSWLPFRPERKNMSSRIVLITTCILIFSGAALYFLFESETSLEGSDNTHKVIAAFFGSISARTAGFNMVDISAWSYPTIFLMITLMWIGASPGSTGGGIKTTTFALAIISVWNNLRGRERLMLGNREISNQTISRLLSIIFLSLSVITAGFFCLLIFEPGKDPVHLLFECVSAFATVGLSLADTSGFSNPGKVVIITLMFIGRVGPLTLFTGLLFSSRKKSFRYPELDIVIN